MTRLYGFGALLGALLLSAGACAEDIRVENAWSRASAPGQNAGMADVTITSKQPATLLGAVTSAAASVELHSMTHEGGMMKMREVKAIELPAGKPVNLGESGFHLMLIGLKAPLKAGETIPLTLSIRTADQRMVKVEARAEVKPLAETKTDMKHDAHMHHGH
ncbi:MAG TPA: copper chaperone PCu(A)C [Gallionella sp.]